MIKTEGLVFEYTNTARVLDGINMDIKPGEFVAILGHNGSGKSTLAKHFNALHIPNEGAVWVNSLDTSDEENILIIRQSTGMVFQNPDNQIVASVVEEDVAFGPENMGISTDEIWRRVETGLAAVNMSKCKNDSPDRLSGGQKQRIAIAGVLAMKPKCIVLDESTAMLDPKGRKEVLESVIRLNKKEQISIVLITHNMEETIHSDKIFVMNEGKIVMSGTPMEIFAHTEELKNYKLEPPVITYIADSLRCQGMNIPSGLLDMDVLIEAIADEIQIQDTRQGERQNKDIAATYEMQNRDTGKGEGQNNIAVPDSAELIKIENLSYVYNEGTPFEKAALKNINITINEGDYVGIIGCTGSGKSTLIQHLNGLYRPSDGNICYKGNDIFDKGFSKRKLRGEVGLVFQYPEYQLFSATVIEDVAFGPENIGMSSDEANASAEEALRLVGISEKIYHASPFDLSGGEMRRVALAGVIAMKPKVLVLDEPTAGLDPCGRNEILKLIDRLHKEEDMTIVLVSHDMEAVAKYVNRLVVMNNGAVSMEGRPRNIFTDYKGLEKIGLMAPQTVYLLNALKERGIDVDTSIITRDGAVSEILKKKCSN